MATHTLTTHFLPTLLSCSKAYAQHNRKASAAAAAPGPHSPPKKGPPSRASPGTVSSARGDDARVSVYSPLKLEGDPNGTRRAAQTPTDVLAAVERISPRTPPDATTRRTPPVTAMPSTPPVVTAPPERHATPSPVNETRGPLMYTERLVRLTKNVDGALGLTVSGG